MRVLVVGGGAREHAILWKLAQSKHSPTLYCAPGNGGSGSVAENVQIPANDVEGITNWAKEQSIDLAVIGPEDPLAAGIADRFRSMGIPVFGPVRDAARIESSKAWAKQLMRRYNVPTAGSKTFSDPTLADDYVRSRPAPIVIKADGLSAGKGVIVAMTLEEALRAVSSLMKNRVLGNAGAEVVIEDYLVGTEVSLLAFTDGNAVIPMVPACDYKRVFDGDLGPNTGGMGAYSPARFVTEKTIAQIKREILEPIVYGMASEGIQYSGVLYAGLMITDSGPKVIEFNCRFGDPETQVILPRLKTDLLEIMLRVAEGTLQGLDTEWYDDACCGVVLASGGYPGDYTQGLPISGLDQVDGDALVFHAGSTIRDGKIVTSGGRVVTVVATGRSMAEARKKAYSNAERICFDGRHYRRDIALREI
jgi:phosphoribosylamine--glycine ligase